MNAELHVKMNETSVEINWKGSIENIAQAIATAIRQFSAAANLDLYATGAALVALASNMTVTDLNSLDQVREMLANDEVPKEARAALITGFLEHLQKKQEGKR